MKIKSLNEVGSRYEIIEVEVHFLPGLPQIHFLGRADSHLKECGLRIRSAFQNSMLQFPMNQKVVVNLTPSHVKKVSAGVELAIAVLILQMTGQIQIQDIEKYVVFGELSLTGLIQFPEVAKLLPDLKEDLLLSGPGLEKLSSGWQCSNISEIAQTQWVEKQSQYQLAQFSANSAMLTHSQAEALKILCLGGHHALIAGAQGTGKTWLIETLISLLPAPSMNTLKFHEVLFAKKLNWVPVARPHHSTPLVSLVGGGVPPKPGEITRAHGGLLFLDEMFEFKPAALEGLREALSSQFVTVSRGLQSQQFPADFQLIGTTNLCPCGKWIPGRLRNCSYNEKRCTSVLQKLSGPLMDRLQGIFYFSEKPEKRTVSLSELRAQIESIRDFQIKNKRQLSNRVWSEAQLTLTEVKLWDQFQSGFELSSARRSQAVLAWARTLADCDTSPEIQARHLQKAYEDCVLSLSRLISH
ncbi:MAG: ATP-binding protein [Bdellovibrionales bacterium]